MILKNCLQIEGESFEQWGLQFQISDFESFFSLQMYVLETIDICGSWRPHFEGFHFCTYAAALSEGLSESS